MRSEPSEERAGAFPAKRGACERRRRQCAARGEARERERMARAAEWPEQVSQHERCVANERRHQARVTGRILPERRPGRRDRALEHRSRSVVERMSERRRRPDPLDAVLRERQRREERRGDGEWMDRRAHVVLEPRRGQLGGAHAAADRLRALDDAHRHALARERDRRGQSVRARADDDRVRHSWQR